MKKIFNWQIFLGIVLILLSVAVYVIHYVIFRDAHHIFIYLIGDIAFVFFEVLLVTLILHQLLNHREKQAMLKKLNMVIGVFFTEVGTELLERLSVFLSGPTKITESLVIKGDWTEKKFVSVSKSLKRHDYKIDIKKGDLRTLKSFLIEKRQFLLGLLGNPNLLEHELFTNLLWAVFHLTEELVNRSDLKFLPESDMQHLANDIKRSYSSLLFEWLDYMRHLKADYPYLFSLEMRTNPFDANASVVIK